jgi:hypothetical protein
MEFRCEELLQFLGDKYLLMKRALMLEDEQVLNGWTEMKARTEFIMSTMAKDGVAYGIEHYIHGGGGNA